MQGDLFAPTGRRESLIDDGAASAWWQRGAVPTALAEAVWQQLLAEAPFAAESPVVFGKRRTVARQSCAFGDSAIHYGYSGLVRTAAPWLSEVAALRDWVAQTTASTFNFLLCNLYPDGEAGLGWHADNEAIIVRGSTIASVSLGATRDFCLRARHPVDPPAPTVRVALGHGDLLVMAGTLQQHYVHAVPKRRGVMAPRINLTFRLLRQS